MRSDEYPFEYRWREVYGINLSKLSAFTGKTKYDLTEIIKECIVGVKEVEKRHDD